MLTVWSLDPVCYYRRKVYIHLQSFGFAFIYVWKNMILFFPLWLKHSILVATVVHLYLVSLLSVLSIHFTWVKAHNNNLGNELADKLAKNAASIRDIETVYSRIPKSVSLPLIPREVPLYSKYHWIMSREKLRSSKLPKVPLCCPSRVLTLQFCRSYKCVHAWNVFSIPYSKRVICLVKEYEIYFKTKERLTDEK